MIYHIHIHIATIYMDLDSSVLSEISPTEKDKCCNDVTYMWNRKEKLNS